MPIELIPNSDGALPVPIPVAALNVYGDPRPCREMVQGPFNLLEIGTSINVLMTDLWAKMFIGSVPYGGRFQRPLGSYLEFQGGGVGTSATANFGAGGNFLPTSNYALDIALEMKTIGFVVPADAPVYFNRMCETRELGSNSTATGHRGYDVPGNGSYNWLRGNNTVRGIYYGSPNDMLDMEQWALDDTNASAGTKVAVPAVANGVYHYVDSPINPIPLANDVKPNVKLIPGSTAINGKMVAVIGFRLFSNDPHWEFCTIARSGSVVDDYIDTNQISLAAWANILSMLETTHVIIDHGVNENPANTQQDFYDKIITLISRARQDYPERRIILMSCYAVPTYEAKLIRNAAAMRQIAELLPYVSFLDINAEFPDSAWNAANLLLNEGGIYLHPNDEGKTIIRTRQIEMIMRLANASFQGNAEGYYAKRAKMLATAGQEQFDAEMRLDALALVADESMVQNALDNADTMVDGIAFEEGITAAGTSPHFVATTDLPVFDFLSMWASRWARADGHLLRGELNDVPEDIPGGPPNTSAEGVFRKMKTEAEKHIRDILSAKRGMQTVVGAGSHGITVGYQSHVRPSCGISPTVKG